MQNIVAPPTGVEVNSFGNGGIQTLARRSIPGPRVHIVRESILVFVGPPCSGGTQLETFVKLVVLPYLLRVLSETLHKVTF